MTAMHSLVRRVAMAVGVAAVGVLGFTGSLLAQTGQVTGSVRNAVTGAPVYGAYVFVAQTRIGNVTGTDGRFTLSGVPAGPRTVSVRVIGFAPLSQEVDVQADQVTTLELTLEPRAVALSEVVVTGLVGATPKAKSPLSVEQLRGTDVPVRSENFAQALQGKVAGAAVVQGSGRPGEAPSVLLRGPTSIGASGRDQEPLYIVDGVILGSSVADIDALDIDRIEVLKGAAAASLYGSRAANGVIQITTKRGSQFADGAISYTARSTFGTTDLPGRFPLLQTHFWELNADGTRFIEGSGSRAGLECDFRGTPGWNPAEQCSGNPRLAGQTAGAGTRNQWNTFATNPWPRGTFDHVDRFFDGGSAQEYYVAASGRQGATNFHVSFSRNEDVGPMLGQEGFRRNNFRVNLDQVVRPNIQVSASAFYSRSEQAAFVEASGNPVFGLTRMMAGVDLASCEPASGKTGCLDDPVNLLLNVNPTNTESSNPLYELMVRDNAEMRGRFLGSANVRWSPITWFDVDGLVSYDRLDQDAVQLRPKGYRTIGSDATLNEGTLAMANAQRQALNASLTGSFRFQLSDRITNRTQVRYLFEQQDRDTSNTGGREFAVAEVHTLGNLNSDFLNATSNSQTIRADGYFFITNFDVYDRYIIDALVRNDGSSLFGADERRQWYGRVAAAWRVGEEPWFTVPAFDELKLRASLGTAGGRPSFAAQYETFSVAGGSIIPINLGNRGLKPEHATERELGVDFAMFNRFDASVTYATTSVDNQILAVPLPAYMGFGSRVQNVGTLESKTWELSLGARLIRTPSVTWSARLLFDRTRSTITALTVPDFRFGVGGQAFGNVFLARAGERLGTFYGPIPARSCADLPTGVTCDGFVVDENGYLVWVGTGSLSDNLWGTSSGLTSGIGQGILWGTPFAGMCTDRVSGQATNFCPLGNTMPDYTIGASTTLDWKGFSLYGLIEAVQGFEIWNQPLSWATFRRNIQMYDQSGVPAGEQKPLGYFDALYGGLGGLVPNGEFVEDGSFVKLRELSLRYRFSGAQLAQSGVLGLRGLQGIALAVTGRNLKTWSNYRGYDPEVGRAGGDVGSAALARVDGFNYPNFRTWTFGVEVTF